MYSDAEKRDSMYMGLFKFDHLGICYVYTFLLLNDNTQITLTDNRLNKGDEFGFIQLTV